MDDDTRYDLDLLKGRIHRLENIIDSLLAYARVGKSESQRQEVFIAQMIEDIVDSLDSDCETEIEGQMLTFVK